MLLLSACALPVAVLAVTLGGVALGQVAALYAAILAWFCALAGLGLLASTVAPTAAKASSLLVAVLVALYGMPALLSSLAESGGATGLAKALHAWLELSVWSRLGAIPMGSPDTWWGWQPVIDVALGALGATGALLLYPRLARDSHDTGGERSGTVRRWLGIGRPRSGLLAIAWKDFHVELGGWRMLIFKALAAIAGAVLTSGWVSGAERSAERIGESWMWPALFWLILEIGVHLSRQWSGELRNRTAELLCMLPVERPTLAYAKLYALPLVLAPPLLWFIAGVVLAPESFVKGLGNLLSEIAGWYGIVMVVFWWHSAAWLSLRWPRFALAGSIILLVLVQIALGIVAMLVRGSEGMFVLAIIGLAIPTILMHASFAGRWVRRL